MFSYSVRCPNASHLPEWKPYESGMFQFMTLDEVCGMKDMGEDKKQFIAE